MLLPQAKAWPPELFSWRRRCTGVNVSNQSGRLDRTSLLTVTHDVVQGVDLTLYATSESPRIANCRCRIMSTKSLERASTTFDDRSE